MGFDVKEGNYEKLGAVKVGAFVVFTFAGEKEDACSVLLIDKKTRKQVEIDVPQKYCLGSLRSIAVKLDKPEQFFYLFCINGKVQIDPYARSIIGREKWNDRSRGMDEYAVYGAIIDDSFDWEDDRQPEIAKPDMIMYKLHVRGFSMDHGAKRGAAGTFAGLCDKLPYLKSLGITTIEMMPVYEFEEIKIPVKPEFPDYLVWDTEDTDLILPEEDVQPDERINYWGYGPGEYFSVKASYASKPQKAVNEFKELIKQMHRMQMECVMEIYFPSDTNHNLILDALRFWAREYHVDGFHLLGENLPITAVAQDIILSRTKIFYTGFDSNAVCEEKKYKNLYIYKEEYQYPARKLLNHINGDMREFLNQQRKQQKSVGYVNYISSNNGFTLADVFMYNDRHNEDNGEQNQDGNAWNFSNNYGVEGPTRKKYISAIRKRQWRNAILMLFLAQGVPLLWSGDEMCNSQKGNNNAYCQDNPVGWLNWKNEKIHSAEISFVKAVIQFRKEHPVLSNPVPYKFCDYHSFGLPDVSYHGENAWISGFDLGRMNIGVLYCGAYSKGENAEDVYIAYNFFSAVSTLALPKLLKKRKWYMAMDSSNEQTPVLQEQKLLEDQMQLSMKPQSICVLVGK